jgi:ATP-dependent Lhr-like helicase
VPTWQAARWPVHRAERRVLEMMQARRKATFLEPELEAARPMLLTQQRLSRFPRRTRCWWRPTSRAKGQHLYIYPFAGRNVHLGPREPDRLAARARASQHLQHLDQRLRLRAGEREPSTWSPVTSQRVFAGAEPAARRAASLNSRRAGAAALPRDRARGGLISSGYPASKRHAPAAGLQRTVLRGVPQVRRRQPAAEPGGKRGAEPGAGTVAARRDAGAHAGTPLVFAPLRHPAR